MTSIGMRHGASAEHRLPDVARRALLACGVVSSVWYAATDLLAGLRYEGYSFFSQTISELGAIGAPRQLFVSVLFLTYTVLMVAFGVGVLLEGMHGNARLKIVGALLLGYMLVGSGTAIFPVHVRGTAVFADELPHIVSGLAAIAVILVAIGVGSATLGARFRVFSWTMFAAIVVFGALTVPFGVKLAAGEPTPGMGVVERIAYYAILCWVAGLSIALSSRARMREAGGRP